MNFNEENIEQQEFSLEKKGYNKEEVKKFLSELKNEIETLQEKIYGLKDENEILKNKVEEYQQIDKKIRNTLVFLKESERDSIIKTKDEISEMLKKAEKKRDELIQEGENEAKSTRDTLLFLKEQQEIMLARLKIIIDNQEGMLKDFQSDNTAVKLQKSMAEAAAFKAESELNIDAILEKLL